MLVPVLTDSPRQQTDLRRVTIAVIVGCCLACAAVVRLQPVIYQFLPIALLYGWTQTGGL
jgi:hypothetical protein